MFPSLLQALLVGTLFLMPYQAALAMSETPSKPAQKYILKFKERVPESRKSQVIEQLDLTKEKDLPLIGAIVCVHKGGQKTADPLKKAESFPEIEYIEPDFQVQTE